MKPWIRSSPWIWALLLLTVLWTDAAVAGRVALVIGNSAYRVGPLENPIQDARAMQDKLSSLGFRVIKRENLKLREIGSTLRELRQAIQPGDDVVVFYAGHGVQVKGVNYLPVVDADIQGEEDIPQYSLQVDQLLAVLEESKAATKLLFLDACRNNPFSRAFRNIAGDLGRVGAAPSGTLIHYATRPGSLAQDGPPGGNGLYTQHLLRHIGTPNLAVETMHKRVAQGVESGSNGRQEPWSEGQLKGEFYFAALKGAGQAASAATAAPPPEDAELLAWQETERTGSLHAIEAFLREYPAGRMSGVARVRLATALAAQDPGDWQRYDGGANLYYEIDRSSIVTEGGIVFYTYRQRTLSGEECFACGSLRAAVNCGRRELAEVTADGTLAQFRRVYTETRQDRELELACRLARRRAVS